ncbi:hypothetical protein [Dokdonia sp.]|uniref:hypothetical protein n=1 Tax=Dokdonia sp. TaxID=2024995 RepID=UPI00326543D5
MLSFTVAVPFEATTVMIITPVEGPSVPKLSLSVTSIFTGVSSGVVAVSSSGSGV